MNDETRKNETPKQDSTGEGADGQSPNAVLGHSLAAAAVCLGTGATIALIAILG
jgi:hypothetical protein